MVRLLKLDDFVLSAEQYRSGKISAAIETDSTRLASDLDVPIATSKTAAIASGWRERRWLP